MPKNRIDSEAIATIIRWRRDVNAATRDSVAVAKAKGAVSEYTRVVDEAAKASLAELDALAGLVAAEFGRNSSFDESKFLAACGFPG